MKGAPDYIIEALIHACPEACKVINKPSQLLPVHLLREWYVTQQAAFVSTLLKKEERIKLQQPPTSNLGTSPGLPNASVTSATTDNDSVTLIKIIEKVRRHEFGHYEEPLPPNGAKTDNLNTNNTNKPNRSPSPSSTVTPLRRGSSTGNIKLPLVTDNDDDSESSSSDDDQTVSTNITLSTCYTMTTFATNREEEECCLETLIQDMFLDQFQQVQSMIFHSYPSPMPTSLVELLLQPLVADMDATSVHGKPLNNDKRWNP